MREMDAIVKNTPAVSVISPIYGVEKFIARSAGSMMRQTLQDVEFIFVDDCSRDRSIDILKEILAGYPDRNVRIIRHTENKGLPSARNTGLAEASGEYVFHWDSDDYAEPEMLEKMYFCAVENDADVVWADWFLTFSENERRMSQPDYDSPVDALKGMLGGKMKYNVWNKLARRSLYDGVRFPDGYGMGEDMTMMLLFARAEKVVHLPEAFYHYLKTNTTAFSNTVRPEHFDALKRNVSWISDELRKACRQDIGQELAFLKLESKYPLLVGSGNFGYYRLWNTWFPEADEYICRNKNVSLRSRLVQQAARYRQYWLVWLHYQLICRLVYGLIYR